jgi:hypothetical protein
MTDRIPEVGKPARTLRSNVLPENRQGVPGVVTRIGRTLVTFATSTNFFDVSPELLEAWEPQVDEEVVCNGVEGACIYLGELSDGSEKYRTVHPDGGTYIHVSGTLVGPYGITASWKPEAGQTVRVHSGALAPDDRSLIGRVLRVHPDFCELTMFESDITTVVAHVGLGPWIPPHKTLVRVVSKVPDVCPIKNDPGHVVLYEHLNAEGCHIVRRLHGDRARYILRKGTQFWPFVDALPDKLKQKEAEDKPDYQEDEPKSEPKAEAKCVWCKPSFSHETHCPELAAVHAERLAAGGVDDEYTREETRRYVTRQALTAAQPSGFMRTSDRAGLEDRQDVSARNRIAQDPEDEKLPPWEAWSTVAWDHPST